MAERESDSFFERLASGNPGNTREVYRFELNRLHSFTTWPRESKIYPTSLARVGLYYFGQSDTVACFHCNVHLGQWEEEDLPLAEHERHSPNCGFIQGQDVGNIPLRSSGQVFSVAVTRQQEDEIRNQRAVAKSIGLGKTAESSSTRPENNVMDLVERQLKELTLRYPFDPLQRRLKRPVPQIATALPREDSLEDIEGLTVHGGSTHNMSSMNPEHGSQVQPLSSANLDTGSSHVSVRQQQINQAILSISTEPVRQGLTEYCPLDVLKSIMQSANHPQYAHINRRIESFATWPYSHVQSPIKLAEAGFYYTGREDRIRCFLCNGGLCNWEAEDIPWYEHCRWFERCRYAMACKKNEVVAAIVNTTTQLRSASTNAPSEGHLQGDETQQTGSVSNSREGSMGTAGTEPNQQTLRRQLMNMGFAEDRVQKVLEERGNAPTLDAALDALIATGSPAHVATANQISIDSPSSQQGASQAAINIVTDPSEITGAASADVDIETRESGSETKDEAGKKKKKKNKKKKGKSDPISSQEGESTGATGASSNIEQKTMEDLTEKETNVILATLREENEALKSRRVCKVCMEKEVCIVFLPCSHLVCCLECAMQLNSCPMCRGPIKATVKVFI